MSSKFNILFEQLVAEIVTPAVETRGFSLKKIEDGIYEIVGKFVFMRIRRGKGHLPSMLITFGDLRDKAGPSSSLNREVGLKAVVELGGGEFCQTESSLAEFSALFRQIFALAQEFGFPYLEANEEGALIPVWEYIEKRIDEKRIRKRKYNLPKNVREEWLK